MERNRSENVFGKASVARRIVAVCRDVLFQYWWWRHGGGVVKFVASLAVVRHVVVVTCDVIVNPLDSTAAWSEATAAQPADDHRRADGQSHGDRCRHGHDDDGRRQGRHHDDQTASRVDAWRR